MNRAANLAEADQTRIKAAVQHAEDKISGEIVPVLLNRSYHYPAAKYKFALLFSLLAFLLLIIGDRFISDFGLYDPIYYFTIVYGAAIAGFLLPVLFPGLAVYLSTEKEKKQATYQQAETVFLEHEVFNTRLRSGIMLFVSFDERQVIVMADSGINKKVDQSDWDQLVARLVQQIKNKQVIVGLEEAIAKCGEILLAKGFKKEIDDTNELSDNLISD